MSVTLYIAEKPSMARDIARVLGASKRDGIKLVGDGVWVSWCIGHLVEIATPDAHDPRWKSWRPDVLPVLPQVIQWEPKSKTRSHLKQLRALLNDRAVSRVVNACDAGREGELIFRYSLELGGIDKPVKRLWMQSMTQGAILDAWLKFPLQSSFFVGLEQFLVARPAVYGLHVQNRTAGIHEDLEVNLFLLGDGENTS